MALRIDLYTRCWKDAHMLGFFFRHYDTLVQRYIVLDDGSTDGSLEILGALPKVEIRSLPHTDPDSRVLSASTLLDNCWKQSRGAADRVIVTDIDEHLYRPDIDSYLSGCHAGGVTIVPALGYQMFTETFPPPDAHLSRTITLGAPCPQMSKLTIFNPCEVEATHYELGGMSPPWRVTSSFPIGTSFFSSITSTWASSACWPDMSDAEHDSGRKTCQPVGLSVSVVPGRSSPRSGGHEESSRRCLSSRSQAMANVSAAALMDILAKLDIQKTGAHFIFGKPLFA